MPSLKEIINEEIQNILNEAVKINFKGQQFVLKVDVNEDPNKKGIKVQFLPTSFGNLTRTEQDDIAIALSEKLSAGLEAYGLDVERDRNLKDKTIIGFFIYIEYLDKIIRKALAGDENGEEIDGGSEEI
jgi:hypothetical protein|tara:strand:+ start:184 stop:570 length:387 start_codon:yes stop_codon:yes gene_type:complete